MTYPKYNEKNASPVTEYLELSLMISSHIVEHLFLPLTEHLLIKIIN